MGSKPNTHPNRLKIIMTKSIIPTASGIAAQSNKISIHQNLHFHYLFIYQQHEIITQIANIHNTVGKKIKNKNIKARLFLRPVQKHDSVSIIGIWTPKHILMLPIYSSQIRTFLSQTRISLTRLARDMYTIHEKLNHTMNKKEQRYVNQYCELITLPSFPTLAFSSATIIP